MELVTLDFLASQLALADQLHARKATMFEPQDLPGRYGRVVKALDYVLEAIGCESDIPTRYLPATQQVEPILMASRDGLCIPTSLGRIGSRCDAKR